MLRKIVLAGLIFTLLNQVSYCKDIKINVINTKETMDFRDVPYSFAKYYPAGTYYLWAIAENKRQQELNDAFVSDEITVYEERYTGRKKYRGYDHAYKSSYRTFGRRGRISTYYNPYFKE